MAGLVLFDTRSQPRRNTPEQFHTDGASVTSRSASSTPLHASNASGTIVAEEVEGTVVLSVAGCLDGDAGAALLAALDAALEVSPERVEVDLAAVDDFTEDGLDALQGCREASFRLTEGMHFRTVAGPGQQAFLSAFQ